MAQEGYCKKSCLVHGGLEAEQGNNVRKERRETQDLEHMIHPEVCFTSSLRNLQANGVGCSLTITATCTLQAKITFSLSELITSGISYSKGSLTYIPPNRFSSSSSVLTLGHHINC